MVGFSRESRGLIACGNVRITARRSNKLRGSFQKQKRSSMRGQQVQGYLAHNNLAPHPGPPCGPRHMLLQVPTGRRFLISEVPLNLIRMRTPLGPYSRRSQRGLQWWSSFCSCKAFKEGVTTMMVPWTCWALSVIGAPISPSLPVTRSTLSTPTETSTFKPAARLGGRGPGPAPCRWIVFLRHTHRT